MEITLEISARELLICPYIIERIKSTGVSTTEHEKHLEKNKNKYEFSKNSRKVKIKDATIFGKEGNLKFLSAIPGVSREHCIIEVQHGTWNLRDLGSTNGTFLNGEKILPNENHVIVEGDIIDLAHTIKFKVL